MSICAQDLRDFVVRPTLDYLGVGSPVAPYLMLGTAAQESGLGFHLGQQAGLRHGFGLYQIDEATHKAVWDQFLVRQPDLASRVRGLASQQEFLRHPHLELTTNLAYATAIAWLIYARHAVRVPEPLRLSRLAGFWLHYYSGHDTEATPELKDSFVTNYRRYIDIGPELAA